MDKSRFYQALRQGASNPWIASRWYDLKPDAPPAPDYAAAASAQGAANVDAAIAAGLLANPQTTNPYGSRQIAFDPSRSFTVGTGADQRTVPGINITDTLSPTEQQKLDMNNQLALGLLGTAGKGLNAVDAILGTPLDTSGVQNITTPLGPGGLKEVSDALIARLQPQMTQDRERLETALVNQGFARGSAGYNQGLDEFNRKENDLRLAALGQATGAQQAAYGMESDARAKAIQELAYLRQLPLSEVNSLRTGNQPTTPQFQAYQGQGVQAAPIYQATADQAKYNLGQYNAEMAGAGDMMNGLFKMGAAAIPFIF